MWHSPPKLLRKITFGGVSIGAGQQPRMLAIPNRVEAFSLDIMEFVYPQQGHGTHGVCSLPAPKENRLGLLKRP